MADWKQYNDIFDKASQTYNVDKSLLLAVAKTESNFNASATSSAGAKGIMQLMDGTAKSLGVTNPYDAEQNIMGGAKYLSQLLEKYNGDTTKALASYNGGMGNVNKYGAERYSKYYTKVYSNLEEFKDVSSDSTIIDSDNLIQTSKKGNTGVNILTVIACILVALIGIVFVALSLGETTGTTDKAISGAKAVIKAKTGDIKGAIEEGIKAKGGATSD